MGLSRSTFYDTAAIPLDAEALLSRIGATCDEFECYGYRRVGAALRHGSVVVNGKKLRRLTREHGLPPKRRRRVVVTTDSDHGGPIFPDLIKDLVPDRPNQLWAEPPKAPRAKPVEGWRGSRLDRRGHPRRLRLPGSHPGRLVTQGGRLPYALYAPAGRAAAFVPGDGTGLRVITMDIAFSGMPDAVWLKRMLPNATVTCRSNDREVQARLCAGGAGLAVLPRPLGDVTPGIVALELDDPPPGRDTFVGYHCDLRRLHRMRALLGLVVERLAN